MSTLSEKEVTHIAKLARLALTPEETKKMTHELGSILTYIDQLQKVNTDGIDPTTQVGADAVRLREDVVKDYDRTDDLPAAAPERVGRLIKTKAVFQK